MNGRERILTAVRRPGTGAADRVGLGDMGFEEGMLGQLESHFGVKGADEVRKALGIDLVGVCPGYIGAAFGYKPAASQMSFFGSSDKS